MKAALITAGILVFASAYGETGDTKIERAKIAIETSNVEVDKAKTEQGSKEIEQENADSINNNIKKDETRSFANVKAIGQAIALFSDVCVKPLPKSLDELIEERYLAPKTCQSPHFDDKEYDYILLHPGQTKSYSKTDLVLVEKPGSGKRRAVLFGDLITVKLLTDKEINELMKK